MDASNNLYLILSRMESIDPDEGRELMSDYDSFKKRIKSKLIIQTVITHYKNAEKCYLNENEAGEKRFLFLALDHIKSYNITDSDLREEGLRDYITGTTLTIKKINMRLESIG
jgi:hypothetical protein